MDPFAAFDDEDGFDLKDNLPQSTAASSSAADDFADFASVGRAPSSAGSMMEVASVMDGSVGARDSALLEDFEDMQSVGSFPSAAGSAGFRQVKNTAPDTFKMEQEIASLRQQLEDSAAKLGEVDALRRQLSDAETKKAAEIEELKNKARTRFEEQDQEMESLRTKARQALAQRQEQINVLEANVETEKNMASTLEAQVAELQSAAALQGQSKAEDQSAASGERVETLEAELEEVKNRARQKVEELIADQEQIKTKAREALQARQTELDELRTELTTLKAGGIDQRDEQAAASEELVTELRAKLSAAEQQAADSVEASRRAADDAALETAPLRKQLDTADSQLVEANQRHERDLAEAATAADARLQNSTLEIESLRGKVAAAEQQQAVSVAGRQGEQEQTARDLEEARSQLVSAQASREAAQAEAGQSAGEAERLRAELLAAEQRLASVSEKLEEASQARSQAEIRLEEVRAESATQTVDADQLEQIKQKAREKIEEQRAELETVKAKAREAIEVRQTQITELTDQVEKLRGDLAGQSSEAAEEAATAIKERDQVRQEMEQQRLTTGEVRREMEQQRVELEAQITDWRQKHDSIVREKSALAQEGETRAAAEETRIRELLGAKEEEVASLSRAGEHEKSHAAGRAQAAEDLNRDLQRDLGERDRELDMIRGRLVEADGQAARFSQAQARIRDLEALCKLHSNEKRSERETELEINRLVHRLLDTFSSEVLTPLNREEPSIQQLTKLLDDISGVHSKNVIEQRQVASQRDHLKRECLRMENQVLGLEKEKLEAQEGVVGAMTKWLQKRCPSRKPREISAFHDTREDL